MTEAPEPPPAGIGEGFSLDRLMVRECLRAVRYGKANFGAMMGMVFLLIGLALSAAVQTPNLLFVSGL